MRCLFGGLRCGKLCGGLVELLFGQHSLFEQFLYAAVRLDGYVEPGLCLLPHVVCGLHLLVPCSGHSLVLLGLRCVLGCARLFELCKHVGGVEHHEGVAAAHRVALAHVEPHHAAGHLARNAVFVGFGLPFHVFGHGAEHYQSHYGRRYHHGHEYKQSYCEAFPFFCNLCHISNLLFFCFCRCLSALPGMC